MARNRKRAKERRARRPQPVVTGRAAEPRDDEAPSPIEHAAPDVELAEAQLALGRPALIDSEEAESGALDAEPAADDGVPLEEPVLAEEAAPTAAVPARREPTGSRLVNFLQGSWRELQRVQWPDRRQVMQATGVVIGFVIVAGVFLGVSDFLAGKLMNYVLTGHFK